MRKTGLFGILLIISVFAGVVSAQTIDPSAPPTGDLDYAEIEQRVKALLPARPGLLKFETLCLFPYAEWPEGLWRDESGKRHLAGAYSIKTATNMVYLLDKAGKTLFAYDLRAARQRMTATDKPQNTLQFDDFAILRAGGVAIADNFRNSVLLFKNNRFAGKIDFDGERSFFRYIEFIEADRLGYSFAVYDSGRDRTYVFSADGVLQWEKPGRAEPVFMGSYLIRLDKSDKGVKVQQFSQINPDEQTISEYECGKENIILDAWAIGTIAGKLAVVVYEGRNNEDHPDYARLLLIKDGQTQVYQLFPNFDARLNLQPPYRLLLTQKGMLLVTARMKNEGIEIVAAQIPNE